MSILKFACRQSTSVSADVWLRQFGWRNFYQFGDNLIVSSAQAMARYWYYTLYLDQPSASLQNINLAPTFDLAETQYRVFAGSAWSLQVLAEDPEFSEVSYRLSGADWLTIDAQGQISGQSLEQHIGQWPIVIHADDGNSQSTQSISLSVLPVNYGPSKIEISNTFISTDRGDAGNFIALLDAEDINSEQFTFSLAGDFSDHQFFTIDDNRLFAKAAETLNGTYQINIEVVDAEGNALQQRVSLQTDTDTDSDGVLDSVEIEQGSDPLQRLDYLDSDGDKIPDFIALSQPELLLDNNEDGFYDYFERYPLNFACDGSTYLNSKSALYEVNTTVSPYEFDMLSWDTGKEALNFNALGFNFQDGFLYALNENNDLLRFEAATRHTEINAIIGKPIRWVNLGKVAGIAEDQLFNRGGFDLEGNYYVTNTAENNRLYIINVASQTSRFINTQPDATVDDILDPKTGLPYTGFINADMSFNKQDGLLYGVKGDVLFSLNPDTGDWSVKRLQFDYATADPETIDVELPLGTFGSTWIDSLGVCLFFIMSKGIFFELMSLRPVTQSPVLWMCLFLPRITMVPAARPIQYCYIP